MSDWLTRVDKQEDVVYGHANEKDESGDDDHEDRGLDDDSFLD